MLTGIFLQLFGLGIALGFLSLFFLFIPFFFILNIWILKKVGEPELARRLGKDYIPSKKVRKRCRCFSPG